MRVPARSWKCWTRERNLGRRSPCACKRSIPTTLPWPNSIELRPPKLSIRPVSMSQERVVNCALLPSLRRRRSRRRFHSMAIAPRRRLCAPGRRSRARLQSSVLPIETFPALERVGCHHGFVGRVPGIELSHDKAVVLENLDKVHRRARQILGLGGRKFITVHQVHGDKIARVDSVPATDRCFERCDALITNQRDVCLGIYVADCCAVYLVDRDARAIGLVHSGKKGTALGIVRKAIESMRQEFEIASGDLIAQLSPC